MTPPQPPPTRQRAWAVTWRALVVLVVILIGLPVTGGVAGAQVVIDPVAPVTPLDPTPAPSPTQWGDLNAFQKFLYCNTGHIDPRCSDVVAPNQDPTTATTVPAAPDKLAAEIAYRNYLTSIGGHSLGAWTLPGEREVSAAAITGTSGDVRWNHIGTGTILDLDVNLEPGFDGFRNLVSWRTDPVGYAGAEANWSWQINPTTGVLRLRTEACSTPATTPDICSGATISNTDGRWWDFAPAGNLTSSWHHITLTQNTAAIDDVSITRLSTSPAGSGMPDPGAGQTEGGLAFGELTGSGADICGTSCAAWPADGVVGRVVAWSVVDYSHWWDLLSNYSMVALYGACPNVFCGLPYIGDTPAPTTTLAPLPAIGDPTPAPSTTVVVAPDPVPEPSTTASTAPVADPTVTPSTTTDQTLGDRIGGFFGDLLRGLWTLFVWLVNSLWQMFTWLVDQVWTMFRWLVDRLWEMFQWLVTQLGNLIRWLADQLWTMTHWIWTQISGALSWVVQQLAAAIAWLGDYIINGVNLIVQWLLDGITADFEWLMTQLVQVLDQLFIPQTTMTAWLDTAFPNGLPTPTSTQVVDLIPKPPTVDIDPNPTDPLPPSLPVPPVDGGLACGPAFHIPDPVNKTYYAPTPSDSGCPGNGPGGARTYGDDHAGDVYGYRVALRSFAAIVLWVVFLFRVAKAMPWASRDTMGEGFLAASQGGGPA